METPQLPPPIIAEGDLSSAGAGKVALCTVTAGHPHIKYMESILRLENRERLKGENRTITAMIFKIGGALLHMFRNQIVMEFFNQYHQEWALFIDDDIGFPENLPDLLLEFAHPVHRPMIGASYIHPLPQGLVPSVFYYDWTQDPHPVTGQPYKSYIPISKDRFEFLRDSSPNALIPCHSTGMGCVLIHRSVFLRFAQSGKWPMAEQWFATDLSEYDVALGEDHTFFNRAAQLGIPLHIRADIELQHYKEGMFT